MIHFWLLDSYEQHGLTFWIADGKLKVSPAPADLPLALVEELRTHKAELFRAVTVRELRKRTFLPRPLECGLHAPLWDVWAPLMTWLAEHARPAYDAIITAEERLRAMEDAEHEGTDAYVDAQQSLLDTFERGRAVMRAATTKVWKELAQDFSTPPEDEDKER